MKTKETTRIINLESTPVPTTISRIDPPHSVPRCALPTFPLDPTLPVISGGMLDSLPTPETAAKQMDTASWMP